MKRFILFFTVAMLTVTASLSAQRNADWSVNVTGNAQQIILQNLTGVPIIQTEKAYVGIDPTTQQVAWTVKRKAGKLISAVLDTEGFDFYNLAGTPFVLISNNVLESRTGTSIISKEKNDYKRVEDYEVIPALKSVLVRTTASNGMLRLYLIGLADGKVRWETDVVKAPSIITVTGINEESEEECIDVPLYTTLVSPDNYLIYSFRKNLAVISPEGKLLWVEKANPAEVMLSPDGKKLLVINSMVAGIGNSPVSVRHATIYRGMKLFAFDLKTGKPSWKGEIKTSGNIRWADPYPDFLTVVWGKGCNLYNYATGEAYWAEDFKGKRVVEILPNEKGYLVTFESGYKTMQLTKSGKELWKKPQIVETDDEDEDDLPEEGNMDVYEYAKGKVLVDAERVRFKPAKGAGMKKWRMTLDEKSRIAYDDSLQNLLLLHDKQLYIVNPDNNAKVFKSFKVDFENIPAFHTLEFRDKGYFFTSSKEFAVFELGTEKLTHGYYPRPFDPEGMFINMISAELAINQSLLNANSRQGAETADWKATRPLVALLPPGEGNTELKKTDQSYEITDTRSFVATIMPPARFEAFKLAQDFAWYFTKKSGKNVLVKIHKDTGAEADQLILDDARPLYYIDEIQKRIYYCNGEVLKVFNM